MDNSKVDLLIQYALGVAAEADELGDRELGPIHLLKFVYLADLAYAQEGGATFTEAPWRFYKFGPWSVEIYKRIELAAKAIGAIERRFPSTVREEDGVRWRAQDSGWAHQLESRLPWSVASSVKRAVHSFGNDTTSLLHHVYRTAPMLEAAPGELLNLKRPPEVSEPSSEHEAGAPLPELSKAKVKKLQALVKRRMEEKRAAKKLIAPEPAPRYDDVFDKGRQWLDGLSGQPVEPVRGRLQFSEDLWKSSSRREPEIP